MTQTKSGQAWTGSYVSGSHPAIIVRYVGPTNHRGSRWFASLKRDSETTWRASVPFQDGPLEAARELLRKQNLTTWQLRDCASIDPDTYAIAVS